MFFCIFLRQAGFLVKSLCGCMCCFFCGGPILIIVGVVIMAAENTREKDVQEYNDAVTAYEAAGSNATIKSWMPATVDVGSTPAALSFAVSAVSDAIEGNLEGITKVGTSYVLKATLSAYATPVRFNFNGTAYVSPISLNLNTPSKTTSVTAKCTSSSGCDTAQMTSYCKNNYGSTATYSGDECDETGSCGTCWYVRYLSEVCSVVTAKAPFTLDTSTPSCFYPFTTGSHRYDSTTSGRAISLSVRKSDDPFLVLQRVTRGDNSFGITKETQQKIGVVILVIGIVVVACLCLMIGLMVWFVVQFSRQNPSGAPQQQPVIVQHQVVTTTHHHQGGGMPVVMGQPVVMGMPSPKQDPYYGSNMMGGSPYQQQPPMNPHYGQEMQPTGGSPYAQQPPPQNSPFSHQQQHQYQYGYNDGNQPYGQQSPQQHYAQGFPPRGY